MIFYLILAAAFMAPAIIAFVRGHHYRWIILALNAFGFTGICWLIAMGWAVWPTEKSLADPVLGNVTGLGERNTGDTLGAVDFGRARGFDQAAAASSTHSPSTVITRLERLAALKAAGLLTEDEFAAEKAAILGH